ncbi:MAG TPA: nuclear transport factor 2 family protein [Gemmatimonadaceae bacterium]|nr:nuclear transport factor 2 family protein [Gemmatimonadaceae bacterium]
MERLLFGRGRITSIRSMLRTTIASFGDAARGIPLLALLVLAACRTGDERPLSTTERAAIADTLRARIVAAYDLSRPGDAVARMMSLYPATGDVVSASGGRVSVSRDSLESGIRAFWQYVGQNMRNPKWTWDSMHVDVLSRDAAVVTATYRVPHLTPRGAPHTIAGALTAAFQRREARWVVVQEHLSDLPPVEPADTVAATGTATPPAHRH